MRKFLISVLLGTLLATPVLALEPLSEAVLGAPVPPQTGSVDEARICGAIMAAVALEMNPYRQSDHVEKSYQGFKLASLAWVQEVARIDGIDINTYMANHLKADVEAVKTLDGTGSQVHMGHCISRTQTMLTTP